MADARGDADAALLARASTGDRRAIDAVWRANRGWLAAVLAAHAPRGVDVEDLLQEVAAVLLSKAREIRDAASLRGWLRTVAVNEARMAARDRAVERRALPRLARDEASTRGVDAARDAAREARETLALISGLPPLYAEPLLLQAGHGLSQKGIAELLEVPETTVETRLARARRMLRQLAAERDASAESVAGAGR